MFDGMADGAEEMPGALGELSPPGAEPQVVRWVGIFFVACFVGLIPWTWYLAGTLPDRQVSSHYDAAWTGFDVMLAIVLLATGVCVLRRSRFLAVTAAAAASFLVIDAWFDIMTSPPGSQFVEALIMGVVAELPLAAACAWLSYRAEHLVHGRITLFLGHTFHWR
jgi:hypothetical protein